MAASRTISIRLGLEGAVELKQQLEGAGVTGGAALEKLRTGLERLGAQDSGAVVAALDRVTQAATRAQAAVGQAQANAFAGVKASSGADDYAKRSADIEAYGAELDRLRAKYNPLYAASKQYETGLDGIARAEKLGAISATEATAAREKLTAGYAAANAPAVAHGKALDGVTVSAGAAAAAQRNLSIQVIQGVSGIATGQPILTTFIQQGHQVVDSSLAMGTGFGGIAAAAKGMVAAIGGLPVLLGVAVVGGIVALGAAAEGEARRMGDLRQQLRATQEGYAALAKTVDDTAKRVAASSTLSTNEARSAAQVIAGAKYFSGTSDDIERLAKMSADLARVWNVDVSAAAGKLKDAINDPAAAAKRFADEGLPAFNAELLRNVERLQAAGRGGDALKLVLTALSASSAGATKDVSPLQKALHDLEQSFYGAKDGSKSLATVFGEFGSQTLATVINGLRDEIELIKRVGTTVVDMIERARKASRDAGQNEGPLIGPDGAPLEVRQTGPRASPAAADPSLAAVVPALREALTSSAERYGVEKQLLARLQLSEGRLLANGTWETSSAGAVGPMQVKPATFNALPGFAGRDINNIQSNLDAGTSLFARLLDKYGSPYLAVLAYHDGETLMDKVLRGERRADTGASYTSSNDAIQQANKVAGSYDGTGRTTSRTAVPVTAARGYDTVSAPTGQDAGPAVRAQARAAEDALGGIVAGTREIEKQNLADRLAAITAQMQRLRDAGREGTAEYKGLAQQQEELTAASRQLLTPQDKHLRGLQDTVAANQGVFAGDQKLIAARQQMAQLERDQGGTFTAAQKRQAETLVLSEQSVELKRLVANIELGIKGQESLTAAYGQGYAAVAQATASQQAYQESIKLFPAGSEQAKAAQALLTEEYLKAARASQEAKLAASTRDNGQQLEYLQKEIGLVGASAEVRTRELAVFKARQELEKSGVAISEEAKTAYLASIAAVADGQSRLAHMNQVFSDLQSIGTQAFDRIGSAITQAFANGGLKALDFGGIVKGVLSEIAQQALKMAILNPALNALFGGSRTTLSDVGGVLGGLFGNGTSLDTSSAASWVVGATAGIGGGLVLNRDGNSVLPGELDAEDLAVKGKTATVGASGGTSFLDTASTGLSAVKALDFVSGGKLLAGAKDFVFNAVGFTPGQSVGSWVSSLIGETASGAAASSGAAVSGAITSEAVTAATANAVVAEAGIGTIGAATNVVLEALPYIGAAITIITDLATGNLRGAAIVAGTTAIGAAVGTIVPGIGTAIGAGVGATVGVLIDTFFPAHPKNSYQDTEVDIRDGRIVAGKRVSQIQRSDLAADSVTQFGEQLDTYLDHVGLRIANADSVLGHLGNGIKGLEQVDSIEKLFGRLDFANDPSDTSNFGVAKGALQGLHFGTVNDLNQELLKVAAFADGMTQLGFQLGSVGKDLTDIQVASVSLTGALTKQAVVTNPDGSVADQAGIDGGRPDPLRVALAHDLPGQKFATVQALSDEIDKVNQFVNGTIPGLLNPVLKTTSASRDLELQTIHTYEGAIEQTRKYGLATDELATAQEKAVDLIRAQGVSQIAAANTAIAVRLAATVGGAAVAAQKGLADFDAGLQGQRDQLKKLYTDTYGDLTLTSADYLRDMAALERTLGAERVAVARQANEQLQAATLNLSSTVWGVTARQYALDGRAQDAELTNQDLKAQQERFSYSKSLIDFYGEAYRGTEAYQDQMTALERVQQGERLAIVKKYADQATEAEKQAGVERAAAAAEAARQAEQARGNVASLFGSLKDYARSLEQGDQSSLSAEDKYALANREFQAVSGAAAAGDYGSASKLSSYSDSLLAASRAVNGSGAAYAEDFSRVVGALDSVGAVADALTASAQRQIAQDQTAALVQSLEEMRDQLRAELVAVRRELQQQARAA